MGTHKELVKRCTRRNKTVDPGGWTSYKKQCKKPAVHNGLCEYHYQRSIQKSLPWGERIDYIPVPEEIMANGVYMKLKTEVGNVNYRLRNGAIQRFDRKSELWTDTELPVDVNLFCIKKP